MAFDENSIHSLIHILANESQASRLKLWRDVSGALKAEPSNGAILLDGMEVKWDVVMPQDPKNCRFAVHVCPERGDAQCLHRLNINGSLRSAIVDFFPFEDQRIRVVTTCHYRVDVVVQKTSEPLKVFGEFGELE